MRSILSLSTVFVFSRQFLNVIGYHFMWKKFNKIITRSKQVLFTLTFVIYNIKGESRVWCSSSILYAAVCYKEMEDGRGGGTVDKNGRAEQYKGRVTVHVIIACIVAATGGSLFGYDVGISGSVLIPSLSELHSKIHWFHFLLLLC